MRNLNALCLALALALSLAACAPGDAETTPAATPQWTPAETPAAAPEVRRTEMAITEAINDQRQEHGLEPLEHRDDLAEIARQFSQQMVDEQFFDHVDPAGESVADRVRDTGITFTAVGENLYGAEGPVGMVDHVERSVSGWMDSPGHRENILREVFTQTGVGMASDGTTVRVTQVFLTP
jgi:uncharacterized protein YkwD